MDLIGYLLLLVLIVAAIVSIPRGRKYTKQDETHICKEKPNTDDTARRIAEANERAHKQNYEDMCRLAGEFGSLRQHALNYGPSLPRLTEGEEVVDAEVTDVAGFIGEGR